MKEKVQMIDIVPRLIPELLQGTKTFTIRWTIPTIRKGIMIYYNQDSPMEHIAVWVTHVEKMPLANVPFYLGKEQEWPLSPFLQGMKEHYPDITLSDFVDVIHHLTPQESAMRISYVIHQKRLH